MPCRQWGGCHGVSWKAEGVCDTWLWAGWVFLGTTLITESKDVSGASSMAAALLAHMTQAHSNSCCLFLRCCLSQESSHQQRNMENWGLHDQKNKYWYWVLLESLDSFHHFLKSHNSHKCLIYECKEGIFFLATLSLSPVPHVPFPSTWPCGDIPFPVQSVTLRWRPLVCLELLSPLSQHLGKSLFNASFLKETDFPETWGS